jgi:Tfp pilus assembly protein PilP
MRSKLASLLTALALCAALAGCKKDAQIESVLAELNTFTQEIVKRVEGAPNPSAGVDDAQKYFDSRKAEIQAKLADLKGVRNFQVSEETRKKMMEQLTDDVMSIAKLQIKYVGQSMRDPAFKAKLEKLVNDYQNLLKSVGA